MTNEQISLLTDPVDLAAAKHADYNWSSVRGGPEDYKWNFSFTDFKAGAEWKEQQLSKLKTSFQWHDLLKLILHDPSQLNGSGEGEEKNWSTDHYRNAWIKVCDELSQLKSTGSIQDDNKTF